MSWFNFEAIKEFFRHFGRSGLDTRSDEESSGYTGKERLLVFIISFILALGLWLMVNLSRNFNMGIEVPVNLQSIPSDTSLVEEVPDNVSLSLSGEGWKLISMYTQPPSININARDSSINLYEEVREQVSIMPEVDVVNVDPSFLELKFAPKVTKQVPVHINKEIEYRSRYGLVGEPTIKPDSITVIGAEPLVSRINAWSTKILELKDVDAQIKTTVELQQPSKLLKLSHTEVTYREQVSEYTEGELRTFIRTRNIPEDREVTYSPSVVTIKYDVPINEYVEAQETIPFRAYVDFSEIEEDTTGYVKPNVVLNAKDLHLKLKSVTPRTVSYYNVLDQ